MKLVAYILLLSCVSCTKWPPEPKEEQRIKVVYVNRWQDDYKAEKLKECRQESVIMALSIFEANPKMTKEDVQRMEKFMLDGCSKHFGLVI